MRTRFGEFADAAKGLLRNNLHNLYFGELIFMEAVVVAVRHVIAQPESGFDAISNDARCESPSEKLFLIWEITTQLIMARPLVLGTA